MAQNVSDSQILDAALYVIAQRGYAGATTRQIAAAAGINEVTLFRRFGNKQKLLRAAVEQEAENFNATGIAYTGDVEADLLRIVQFYRDLMAQRGQVVRTVLSEIPRQPELLEIMQVPFTIMQRVTALIERYQEEGALVPEPPLQAFVALMGPLLLGGVVESMGSGVLDAALDPTELVRHYLHGRLHGRAPR